MSDELLQVQARLAELASKVNENDALLRRGRWVSLAFVFGVDERDFLIEIAQGQIARVRERTLPTDTGVFAIRAAATTWLAHWQRMPRRDYHDIWSMLPRELATLDGDLVPLIQNLQYFKDVIASVRES